MRVTRLASIVCLLMAAFVGSAGGHGDMRGRHAGGGDRSAEPCGTATLTHAGRPYRPVSARGRWPKTGYAGVGTVVCSRLVVCRDSQACTARPRRRLSRRQLTRLRGVDPGVALADRRASRIYVALGQCVNLGSGRLLLECLRRARPATGKPLVQPPRAGLATTTGLVPLALGSFCWSGPNVRACADALPESTRFDLPLVWAAPTAVLEFRLGYEPEYVPISAAGGSGRDATSVEYRLRRRRLSAGQFQAI